MKEVTWMEDGLINAVSAEATEGECSEQKGAAGASVTLDPEVPEKATRRKFSTEYKLRILRLADSCADPGSLGKLLRKEGLYSSNLTTWRRQREKGVLEGLKPAKRGRKTIEPNPLLPELENLRKENQRIEKRLKRAELIIEVQKKISQILGLDPPEASPIN